MRPFTYCLLYFVLICSHNHVKGAQKKVPRQCKSYVNSVKIDSLTKISELEKIIADKENEISGLKIDNRLLNDKISIYEKDLGKNLTITEISPKPTTSLNSRNDQLQASGCERIIDHMLETVVYDDRVFDVKKEEGGNGIRIKKLKTGWRTVSFPKSQKITSFTVINKRGSNSLFSSFFSTPYIKKTGWPSKKAGHESISIGAGSFFENYFMLEGNSLMIVRRGIPKWEDKNDSFTLTKRSNFTSVDLEFTTSSGYSKFTFNATKYDESHNGTYMYDLENMSVLVNRFDVENMTPVIQMLKKKTDILITNIRDADNQDC